jgi:exo-beta-1,3-glucanase (GH17 family)
MHVPTSRPATRFVWLLLFILLAALANIAGWWWPNRPVQVGHGQVGHAPFAAADHVVESMSFAPFRRGQSPLTKTYPTAEQVIEDLRSLQGITRGIRTYTSREGLEVVPPEAQKLGLSVMQGVWLGPERDINDKEVAAAIALANQYPDAIKSLVVGNEVLLRKDLPVDELIGYIRKIKAAVKQPVTYADVWEFWLRFPQLLQEVDFVTVHFLPYWEDLPIAASHAMPHIMEVYRTVKAKLPGKPITIGEVGWPSEGRSRRDAVPARTEAAGFIADFMQTAKQEGLSYNLVEAFDQPWKVKLEGTVGGAWGVLDELRQPKFEVGGLVSNLPEWPLFAGLGVLLLLILLVLHAQAVVALSVGAMAAAVAFAQVLAALLAAAIERGLEYNFSLVHQTEAVLAILLLGLFTLLLFRRLLVLLDGRNDPAPPSSGSLGSAFASLRMAMRAISLRNPRLGEIAYGVMALWMTYHAVMLVAAGRYRDFPIDYFLLPVAGLVLLRLIAALFGRNDARGLAQIALAGTFVAPQSENGPAGHFGWEAVLAFLLLCLPVLVMSIETLSNLEALYWCAITVAYALPLLGNLSAARQRSEVPAAAAA